jgi:aryl-alcohol dehydrogenase-like predicted oxidoreductase
MTNHERQWGGLGRRAFLAGLTAAGAGLAWRQSLLAAAEPAGSDRLGRLLPQRQLGRSKARVTALCVGGHHIELRRTTEQSQAIIEEALARGVRFFDNAKEYGQGEAEKRYGQFLSPKYRDLVFIMTKSPATTAAAAKSDLEESLTRMKCDYLDLWQIHHLTSPRDAEARLKNGVLDVFLEAKRAGKARHLGFTGHSNYQALLRMLELLQQRGVELDACQMPINLCDPHYESFTTHVLPVLQARNYGVLAMKTMAYGAMVGQRGFGPAPLPNPPIKSGITPRHMHHYVYSLPVSAVVSGCTTPEEVRENAGFLTGYAGMEEAERKRLLDLAKPHAGKDMERYKAAP